MQDRGDTLAIRHQNKDDFISGMQGQFSIRRSVSVTQHVSRLKERHELITTIHTEEASGKVLYVFKVA